MHLTGQRPADRGQVLISFAISFGVLLMGLSALIVNLSTLYAQSGRASEAALLASQAGAARIDTAAFAATGRLVLDRTPVAGKPTFVASCETAGDVVAGPGSTTCSCPAKDQPACDQPNEPVVADVAEQVPLPIPLPGMSPTARVSAQQVSEPLSGGAAPAP